MITRRYRLMLQAYCAGLLRPTYQHKMTSMIREEWLLSVMAQRSEHEMAVNAIQVRASFASRLKDPAVAQRQMLKQLEAFWAYGEGNPAALLPLMNQGYEMDMLKEVWKDMDAAGILSTNARTR